MNIIFIYGAPGVGKYTVAREIYDGKKYRLLHNHLTVNLVKAVLDFGTDEFWNEVEKLRMDLIQLGIKNRVPNLIITQVIEKEDTDFIEKLKLEMVRNGSEIYFIRLVCDIDTHMERVSMSERKQLNKTTNSVKIREEIDKKKYDCPIDAKFSYTINNTFLTPKEVKEKILTFIKTD